MTWPNINRGVSTFIRSCVECQKQAKDHCQKQAKDHIHKANLQPLSILGCPFQRIAFDIVGPYPLTKKNHMYILTSICYFSSYPEAISLTKVDETSVAEAMIEIFSRCGLPAEILTYQGSVFMGKLMNQLCKLISIKPIHTSPYHPQTDGLLERWHADILAMLKQATNCKTDWDLFVPHVIFAYRQTPHSLTGFSPFQLIYGVNVRGSLEVLRELARG